MESGSSSAFDLTKSFLICGWKGGLVCHEGWKRHLKIKTGGGTIGPGQCR